MYTVADTIIATVTIAVVSSVLLIMGVLCCVSSIGVAFCAHVHIGRRQSSNKNDYIV